MTQFIAALPSAVLNTILITILSLLAGSLLAVPLMLARISSSRALSRCAAVFIDVVRGVPPLVWIFIIYYGIKVGQFRFGTIETAVMGFGLISTAYLAEVYRGGYLAVHKGQFEAAMALALSRRSAFGAVLAPQAFRVALPGIVTYAIGLLKDTSIVSVIGVVDIVFVASSAARQPGADSMTPFFIAAALYLVLSVPLALASRGLERLFRKKVLA
ncbi:amino acid ABC transporter permease [Leucobacter japonicus]|uniref:amino acid ABC transporter permease n=1 Tax=Leucobacter japonicus TaxID=1461259 RepID=UPI0006A7C831|nr:amino acid ABC transporter permease [Leucobacter japonicus]